MFALVTGNHLSCSDAFTCCGYLFGDIPAQSLPLKDWRELRSCCCCCAVYISTSLFSPLPSLLEHDECATGLHNCDENALCFNTVGGHSCSCKPGYTGNGTVCRGRCPPEQPHSRHKFSHTPPYTHLGSLCLNCMWYIFTFSGGMYCISVTKHNAIQNI